MKGEYKRSDESSLSDMNLRSSVDSPRYIVELFSSNSGFMMDLLYDRSSRRSTPSVSE
jgi:hypothetical protein